MRTPWSHLLVALSTLDINMPHLTVLDMNFSSSGINPERYPNIELKPTVLEHVRILRLTSFGFRWDQIALRNMTELKLSENFPLELRASVMQILEVLQHSPGLRVLELRHVIRDDKSGQEIAIPRLCLSKLEVLLLMTDGTTLAKTIIHPSILPNIHDITLDVATNNESTMTDLMVSFAKVLRRQPLWAVYIFHAERNNHRTFNMIAHSNMAYEISFSNTWTSDKYIDTARVSLPCMTELNLNGLEKFSCDFTQPLSMQWWRDSLEQSSELRSLLTRDLENPSGLLFALTPECTSHSSGTLNREDWGSGPGDVGNPVEDEGPLLHTSHESAIFLASLSNLTLMDITFTPSPRRSENVMTYAEGSLDHLAHCLKQRMECGFQLNGKLHLNQITKNVRKWRPHLEPYVKELSFSDDDDYSD